MAKLDYNDQRLTINVQPNIDESIRFINKAIEVLDNTVIPDDFEYKIELKNIRDSLDTTKISLKETNDWITDSINKINKVDDELLEIVNTLPTNSVTIKNNII